MHHGRVGRAARGAAAAALVVGLAATPARAAARTVVTLGFDDGYAEHAEVARLLQARGLRGTFFLSSGRLGRRGYLSWAQARAIAAAGQEIGGHTADHRDLTTLAPDAAREQVCADRERLLAAGLDAQDFAYPFGGVSAEVERIVAGCGYRSARVTRGVADAAGTCGASRCAAAESLPPADPFATRAPGSVKTTWTLGDLQRVVTRAEERGGGWVQLSFHRVCDCPENQFSTSPAVFEAFLDWVAARREQGTVVLPVREALAPGEPPEGPPEPPAPPGPAPGDPAAPGGPTAPGEPDRPPEAIDPRQPASPPDATDPREPTDPAEAPQPTDPAEPPGAADPADPRGPTGPGREPPPADPPGEPGPPPAPPALDPPVAEPPPPLPIEGNLLANPSFEEDGDHDGRPDCWSRVGFGVNTFVHARVPDAHSGAHAERVDLSSYASGDRRVMTARVPEACLPPLLGARSYRLSAHYKATRPTRISVSVRGADGSWQFWRQGPRAPASSGWAVVRLTTPPIPDEVTGVSVGVELDGPGSLVVDDAAAVEVPLPRAPVPSPPAAPEPAPPEPAGPAGGDAVEERPHPLAAPAGGPPADPGAPLAAPEGPIAAPDPPHGAAGCNSSSAVGLASLASALGALLARARRRR